MTTFWKIVVIILLSCFAGLFVYYNYHLDTYCWQDSSTGLEGDYKKEIIPKIAACSRKPMCHYVKGQVNNKNEVRTWMCNKNTYKIFETDTYDVYKIYNNKFK